MPNESNSTMEDIQQLPVDKIYSDSIFNCRGKLTPLDYIELANDMKDIGQLQPIIVQKWDKQPGFDYRIVVGHCRHAAAKFLKWPTVGAIVREFVDESAAYRANAAENMIRRQLNIAQESKIVTYMLSRGTSKGEIQAKLGKTAQWVNTRAEFRRLPVEIQDEAIAGTLSTGELNAIMRMPTTNQKYAMVRSIKAKKERIQEYADSVSFTEEASTVKPERLLRQKRPRKPSEIESVKNYIYTVFGSGLATRALAWAEGNITGEELVETMGEIAANDGLEFSKKLAELAVNGSV